MDTTSNGQHIESLVTLDTVCPRCGDKFTASTFAVRTSEVHPDDQPGGIARRMQRVGSYVLLGGALSCAIAAGISPHRTEVVRLLASGSVLSASIGAGIQLVARFGTCWLPR